MIKRIIPPHVYTGTVPDGYRFVRFEEYNGCVEGVTFDGQRIVIPQAKWWVKE